MHEAGELFFKDTHLLEIKARGLCTLDRYCTSFKAPSFNETRYMNERAKELSMPRSRTGRQDTDMFSSIGSHAGDLFRPSRNDIQNCLTSSCPLFFG